EHVFEHSGRVRDRNPLSSETEEGAQPLGAEAVRRLVRHGGEQPYELLALDGVSGRLSRCPASESGDVEVEPALLLLCEVLGEGGLQRGVVLVAPAAR